MRTAARTTAVIAAGLLVSAGVFYASRPRGADNLGVQHVVVCDPATSTAERCNILEDRRTPGRYMIESFDATGMSRKEMRRQVQARRLALHDAARSAHMLTEGDRINKLYQDLQCGKITRAEFNELRSRRAVLSMDSPIMDRTDDCKFGDPDCENWKTYFSGPPPYCMAAAVNCIR
jgi:hypothetical protein